MTTDEPSLAQVLEQAAAGRSPAPDGLHVVPAPPGPVDAVVGFSFHNIVATSVPADEVLAQLDAADPSGPLRATFLAWLGSRLGAKSGSLDVVLACADTSSIAASSTSPLALSRRADLLDHPRVRRAAEYRTDLIVAADDRLDAVAIAGRGLAGRWEISFELDEPRRGAGHGQALAAHAAALVPAGRPVFAQVAPANASSLRALLAVGFRPIGAEVLFRRA